MDEKKKSAAQPQEQLEELCDAQLSKVSGGTEFPVLPVNGVPGLILDQGEQQPSISFKPDDGLPSND